MTTPSPSPTMEDLLEQVQALTSRLREAEKVLMLLQAGDTPAANLARIDNMVKSNGWFGLVLFGFTQTPEGQPRVFAFNTMRLREALSVMETGKSILLRMQGQELKGEARA